MCRIEAISWNVCKFSAMQWNFIQDYRQPNEHGMLSDNDDNEIAVVVGCFNYSCEIENTLSSSSSSPTLPTTTSVFPLSIFCLTFGHYYSNFFYFLSSVLSSIVLDAPDNIATIAITLTDTYRNAPSNPLGWLIKIKTKRLFLIESYFYRKYFFSCFIEVFPNK